MAVRPQIHWYKLVGVILIAGGLLIAAYPFSPLIVYHARSWFAHPEEQQTTYTESDIVANDEDFTAKSLPEIDDKKVQDPVAQAYARANRIIIPKIGVDMEIFQGGPYSLEQGAWLLPSTALPEQIGNTIITAHRYKYRPPSSKTFYLLDKMEIGDTFIVHWDGKEYAFLIDKKEVKSANDFSILEDTYDRRVSLITCTPLFSTANRLVVSGRLVRNN